ncbi:hypothetical protein GQ457_12G012930 [Hibiscus cannabinus]
MDWRREKKLATIYNVFTFIRGLEEHVLMGNHRDAWTYGAVDPNSGTAALLDIARRYSLLMRKGWNPRRTIIFCSWDAKEFGMIGSTEWVEQNLVNLGAKAVAYLTVDCAVQGPGFFAGATPQLDNLIFEVTKKVNDPDSEVATIYDKWKTMNGKINVGPHNLLKDSLVWILILQHAGVPSVDIYYGRDFPVYHTAFDSFNWVINYAGVMWLNLMALEFTDDILALKIRAWNDRLMLAERGFLDTDGIKGKEWFKHLIYGPRSNHRMELDFFPGISDAIAVERKG